MALRRTKWLQWSIGAVFGGIVGALLAMMDLQFLGRLFDLDNARTFPTSTTGLISWQLIGLNVCCCVPIGVLMAALVPSHGAILARVVRGAVLGGYLGAAIGLIDVVMLASYLNLLNSELVAVWREHRSVLVILNSAGFAVAGALAYAAGRAVSSTGAKTLVEEARPLA